MILKLNILMIMAFFGLFDNKTKDVQPIAKTSVHKFIVKDIEGNDFDFSLLKGKKIMIVNTASECGLTPQYEGLQNLYAQNKSNNFMIVGFPANNFGAQEPGSNHEIAGFCQKNYGVEFPMMSKISVKGDDQHDIYKFLTDINENGVASSDVTWNFQKYLLDENGFLVKSLGPQTLPEDHEISEWLSSK